jgi:DnaJ-class molecular chaperone
MGNGQRSRGDRKRKHQRCPVCLGNGVLVNAGEQRRCRRCGGTGYLRRRRR